MSDINQALFTVLSAATIPAHFSIEKMLRNSYTSGNNGPHFISSYVEEKDILKNVAGVNLFTAEGIKNILARRSKSKTTQKKIDTVKPGNTVSLFTYTSTSSVVAYKLTEADQKYLLELDNVQKNLATTNKSIQEAIPKKLLEEKRSLEAKVRSLRKPFK